MPQFDILCFMPQLIWLFVVFTGFYMCVVQFYLPQWARVLKLRQKMKFASEPQKVQTSSLRQAPNIGKFDGLNPSEKLVSNLVLAYHLK